MPRRYKTRFLLLSKDDAVLSKRINQAILVLLFIENSWLYKLQPVQVDLPKETSF